MISAHDGREVPSNHAAPEEILALASVLSEFDHGAIEIIPRTFVEGYALMAGFDELMTAPGAELPVAPADYAELFTAALGMTKAPIVEA